MIKLYFKWLCAFVLSVAAFTMLAKFAEMYIYISNEIGLGFQIATLLVGGAFLFKPMLNALTSND